MRKQFIGTTKTWSAKVDAKEREMQLAVYQREHTDNSLNGNSATNYHDVYRIYRDELKESDYESFLESMPTAYVEPGKVIEHIQKKELNLTGSILDIIANNNIHVAITASIVRRLAYSQYIENAACMQIVNNRFHEPIFDDLCMAVYETMIKLYNNNELSFDMTEKKLVFAEREKESGKTSAYVDLYKAVSNELALYKSVGHNNERTTLDDMTNYRDIADFTQSAELEKMVSSEMFKSFMMFIQIHDRKNYDDYINILCGLFSGVSYKNIADKFGISERRVKYLKFKLEIFYRTFYHGTDKFHTVNYYKYDRNGHKKTDKEGNPKQYSYKYYMF